MNMLIEKAIPVPGHQCGRKRGVSKYPVRKLEVGESFLIPKNEGSRVTVIAIASRLKKEFPGRNYTTRKTPEGYRTWRIA